MVGVWPQLLKCCICKNPLLEFKELCHLKNTNCVLMNFFNYKKQGKIDFLLN